jgi:hypothetical protein
VVLWNARYINAALDALRAQGYQYSYGLCGTGSRDVS